MLSSKEALERIIKSHFTAMACLGTEDKETQQAIDIVKKDLDRLEELEKQQDEIKKDLLCIAELGFENYKFPNGRIIWGIDITNIPSQQEIKKRLFERQLKYLKEVLEICQKD